MENTVEYLSENLESLRGSYICVSNVHTTVMAYRDEQYRKVQNESAMNLPDGKPLSIVQKMKGFSQAERVPGPDLMPEIFKISEEKGYRHLARTGSAQHRRVRRIPCRSFERGGVMFPHSRNKLCVHLSCGERDVYFNGTSAYISVGIRCGQRGFTGRVGVGHGCSGDVVTCSSVCREASGRQYKGTVDYGRVSNELPV